MAQRDWPGNGPGLVHGINILYSHWSCTSMSNHTHAQAWWAEPRDCCSSPYRLGWLRVAACVFVCVPACVFIPVSIFTRWHSCVCVHVCALATTFTSHLKSQAKVIHYQMQGWGGWKYMQREDLKLGSATAMHLCLEASLHLSTHRRLHQIAKRCRNASEAEHPHPSGPPPRRNPSSSTGTSSCFLLFLPYHPL